MKSITRAYNKLLFYYVIPVMRKLPFVKFPTAIDVYSKFRTIQDSINAKSVDLVIALLFHRDYEVESIKNEIHDLIRYGELMEAHYDGIAYLSEPNDPPQFRHKISAVSLSEEHYTYSSMRCLLRDFSTDPKIQANISLLHRILAHLIDSENNPDLGKKYY